MLGTDTYNLSLSFLFIGILLGMDNAIGDGNDINQFMGKLPSVVRWVSYLIILLIIADFGVFGDHPFIYFQF